MGEKVACFCSKRARVNRYETSQGEEVKGKEGGKGRERQKGMRGGEEGKEREQKGGLMVRR